MTHTIAATNINVAHGSTRMSAKDELMNEIQQGVKLKKVDPDEVNRREEEKRKRSEELKKIAERIEKDGGKMGD